MVSTKATESISTKLRNKLNHGKGKRADFVHSLLEEAHTLQRLVDIDPTPGLKYLKWLVSRFLRFPNESCILTSDGNFAAREILLEYDAIKNKLEVDQRDIFRYTTINQINDVIAPLRKNRNASKHIVNSLDLQVVFELTHILAYDDLSVHKPRTIEDVIALTGSHKVFDNSGGGLYKSLMADGEVLIFITGTGVMVGSLPKEKGQKGCLFDCFGEPCLFEDALTLHPSVTWENCEDLLSIMIKIDPCLPFDMDMENPSAYKLALEQFPLVLEEDRYPPESVLTDLLRDHELQKLLEQYDKPL